MKAILNEFYGGLKNINELVFFYKFMRLIDLKFQRVFEIWQ